ncbi:MAG: sigma-70 family RNA polymerase sigma factor, partial [Desulfosporosinus sp.]|nr:sigma-70 family RNA polymerase sigma factor [Desulfosporosinus sp.]
YDKLIESDYQLKEHRFTLSASAEELARDVIALERLQYALKELTADERELVEELYFKQNSEREYEKSTGIPRKTVAYRRAKILAKLRKLMDNK